ncbi:MAG: hypothetical protein M3N54_07890, partial [Acidobacteriota bacterium]|nr:hypothetical protein [Acidobacteriota bacterium]
SLHSPLSPYCSGYPDTVTHPSSNPFAGNRLFRLLLVFEFLLALQVVFTFWSQVGGQYHLDLMYWPWKFGLSLLTAGLITALTAQLIGPAGINRGRVTLLGALLLGTIVLAGIVTYYYHVNEPGDDQQDDTEQPARVS